MLAVVSLLNFSSTLLVEQNLTTEVERPPAPNACTGGKATAL
jgi:hypothetical protein